MPERTLFYFNPEVQAEPDELKFLDLLNEKGKVIFDWGHDALWIVEDDESQPENRHSIMGERFHAITGTSAASSADTVISLLKRGVDVEVRNAENTFKTSDELAQFMKEAAEKAEQPEAE